MRKLHILFPMKFSGVAETIEIAWAGQLGHAGNAHEQLEDRAANRKAPMLTVKKRHRLEAGVAAASPERPVAVPPEVVQHGDDEGRRGRDQVVQRRTADARGEHAQVHHVAGRADRAELDQLHPVVRLAQARAHAQVNGMWAVGDGCPRLVGHRANGTPK